jgi:hypothetical protein
MPFFDKEDKEKLDRIYNAVIALSENVPVMEAEIHKHGKLIGVLKAEQDRHGYRIGRVERHVGIDPDDSFGEKASDPRSEELDEYEKSKNHRHISIPIGRAGQLVQAERERDDLQKIIYTYRWYSKAVLRMKGGIKYVVKGAAKKLVSVAITGGIGYLIAHFIEHHK